MSPTLTSKTLRIGSHTIGAGNPVFIIAEAGVNHNGDVDFALKLVDAAAEAGADAVKFQTFTAEEVVTGAGDMADYQKRNTGKEQSQLEMIRALELSEDEFKTVADHCSAKGIIFLSAPHSGFGSVDVLERLRVPAFKFGSADLNNFPVLDYTARLGKPLIISTGMADIKDIEEAVACIRAAGNDDIVVFQCTTDYPSKLEDVNLRAMPTIRDAFDVIVGYSDHTIGNEASIVAVALGASVLEKHLTLDNAMDGPDHQASADPDAFIAYVKAVRDAEIILGSAEKTIADSARKYLPLVLKSVVARGPIPEGTVFTKENLAIKRPASGLAPKFYTQMLGLRATRSLGHDEQIQEGDYA